MLPNSFSPSRLGASRGRRLRERDRALLADAVRHGRLLPSQAWRWYWPAAASDKLARNRLAEYAAAGLMVRAPVRFAREGVYVPTPAGARLAACGLAAPRVPSDKGAGLLARLGHDLTVAEVSRWLLARSVPGAAWRTERELLRERVLARPPRARRGGAGLGFRPDGALVLPSGERLAVEVELHDKSERLGRKLAWYARESGYTGVLWVTHRPAIQAALEAAFRRELPAGGVAMRVELLPPEVAVWSD